MSVGLETNDIIQVLSRLSKIPLPARLQNRIADWTSSYGKIRLVLKHNKYFLESTNQKFLVPLLNDPVIASCKVDRPDDEGQQVHGLEKGTGPNRDLIIPGTEAARRAERGEGERPRNDRDDVIGAVIGLDRSMWSFQAWH
jgi:DNA excision repair protein ERCC-3